MGVIYICFLKGKNINSYGRQVREGTWYVLCNMFDGGRI